MTEAQVTFEEVDTDVGVTYRFSHNRPVTPTSVPAKAKSMYADEHNVDYSSLRATVVGEYVIVGQIPET